MSFSYSQSTGQMTRDGELVATGYSGNGPGLNNAAAQMQKDVGPIPQGLYTIEPPHADPVVGPIAMRLDPAPGNEMYGRGDFLIHGDNAAMDHTASEGCIVLPRDARVAIGGAVLAGDDQLLVTA